MIQDDLLAVAQETDAGRRNDIAGLQFVLERDHAVVDLCSNALVAGSPAKVLKEGCGWKTAENIETH